MQKIRNPLTIVQKTEGGEITGDGAHLVTVYDYDGTILKQERLDAGEVCTMPTVPEHDRLVFQTWTSSKEMNADGNSVTVGNGNIAIGATYKTASGNTEFDVVLTKATGLTVSLYNLTGVTSIIWGDGTTNTSTSHTYAKYGKYTIQVVNVTQLGQNIFGQSAFQGSGNHTCVSIRLAENVKFIAVYAIQNLLSLTTITIPQNVRFASYTFDGCISLKSIVLPTSTSYTLGMSCFRNCYVLQSVVIPYTITSIDTEGMRACFYIKNIIFPENIDSIQAQAFLGQNHPVTYDFSQATQVPTLSNTNAFTNINDLSKIIVPDSLYNQWIAATNWSTYANYIYKASEVTE